MFAYLYEWIKNIAFYLILATAFFWVLPREEYKKYIRFFSGLILVILLAMPVFKILDMEGDVERYFREEEKNQVQEEIKKASEFMEERLMEEEEERKDAEMEDVPAEEK